jgi:hypothetical protein
MANNIMAFKKGGKEEVIAAPTSILAPKNTVTQTSAPSIVPTPMNVDRFRAWGDLSKVAQGQGWQPTSWNADTTTFINNYDSGLNRVQLPDGSLGHIAIQGGNNNGLFSIMIRDKKGNVVKEINKGLNAKQVQDYLTNQNSTIAQRQRSVERGQNIDMANERGESVSL